MRLISVIFLAAALFAPSPARAHPHVWIETRANFVFDQGKLIGLDLDWLFDEMFSASMSEDFDNGHKGHFDDKDVADLTQQVLPGYADFGYYTHMRVDGKEVKLKPANFAPTLDKGQVRFRFRVLLPAPVDPGKHALDAGLYDETFFVDLELAADSPIGFTGIEPGKCATAVEPDPAHKIYFGQVTPQVIKLKCHS